MNTQERKQPLRAHLRTLVLASAMGTAAFFGAATNARAALVGHWLTGAENLLDTSGSAIPAGTHDGVAVGGNAGLLTYSTDLPPGFTSGKSLDLTANNVAVQIKNTSNVLEPANGDTTYYDTFDTGVANQLTVAFWAKGFPGTWAPWVSKRGENTGTGTPNIGWQVRRMGSNNVAGFTVRGLSNDNGDGSTINVNNADWHHYVAVWDQASATRKLYVDGVFSHTVTNTAGQTVTHAAGRHLVLGGRKSGTGTGFDSYFQGKLFDVRVYNHALDQTDVYNLIPQLPPQGLAVVPGFQKVQLSWTASRGATEYTVETKNVTTGVTSTETVTEPFLRKEGLTNGVQYLFRVLGSNAGGSGAYSTEVSATPAAGTGNNILTFDLDGIPGPVLISGTSITKYAHPSVDLTGLLGYYTISPFAVEDPNYPADPFMGGGVFRDFTTPQTYTITAENGSTKVYTVTVIQLAPITYDFVSDLQGWTQIWPAPGTVSLWQNGSGSGSLGDGADAGDTRFGRSPDFFLNKSGDLTFKLAGGQGVLATPGLPTAIPAAAISGNGFTGVALRDVTANTYVLSKRRNGVGPDFLAGSFTAAELAPYVDNGKRYTLDFIDYNSGGWGWSRLDDVSIPGSLAPPIAPAPLADITTFTYLSPAVINGTNITLPALAYGTPVTALAPTFTLSAGATCDKVSGSPQDFTSPVTYTVTSAPANESGPQIVKVYTVSAVVMPDPAAALVGHWVSGADNLTNTSVFAPGVHDGVAVGPNAGLLAYSTDVPTGFSGKSLDMSAGNFAVQISNSATTDAAYQTTFDDQIRSQVTVAFWAKGFPGEWAPWISKGGEGPNGGVGWQVRRIELTNFAGFTIRGLGNPDGGGGTINVNNPDWHHYAAVWDQSTGIRSVYVDGVLSHSISTVGSVMTLPSAQHLVLGGRQNEGNYDGSKYYSGKLYDVRIYKQKLFPSQVQAIMTPTSQPSAFSTWINANYPALSDKTAGGDPDGDGMTNQQEFAFGLNPGNGASVNPIIAVPSKTTGKFRYTRLATSGLTYTVKTSDNLVLWTTDAGATASQAVVATNGDVQTVEVTLTGAPLGASKLFVQVLAE